MIRGFAAISLLSLSVSSVALAQATHPAEPTRAQPSGPQPAQAPSPEAPGAIQESQQHFETGMAHYAAHRFREAIREFQLAAARISSADLWYNIARCHEQLGDQPGELELAVEFYQRYLRDRVEPPDRAAVEGRIAALQERIEAERRTRRARPDAATLRLESNPPAERVFVDGRERTSEMSGSRAVGLPPGAHRLRIERSGFLPFVASMPLEAAQRATAYAELLPATRYRTGSPTRIWTWVAGGLSVASLGTGIYFGADASRRLSDGDRDGARRRVHVSDAFVGGAIGLAITAVVLWFAEGAGGETERLPPPDVRTAPRTDTATLPDRVR